jgi:hypothetical protein
MAKLDWLFLPTDIDEDAGEDWARRPRRAVRQLHPRSNLVESKSGKIRKFERMPGNCRFKARPLPIRSK